MSRAQTHFVETWIPVDCGSPLCRHHLPSRRGGAYRINHDGSRFGLAYNTQYAGTGGRANEVRVFRPGEDQCLEPGGPQLLDIALGR